MISINNLYKQFDDKIVLENVNIKFCDNKINCLMGRSGIGKTTLINIIIGFEKCDRGNVEITQNKSFSLVFQEDRLCGNISPIKNISIACPNVKKDDIIKDLKLLGFQDDDFCKITSNLSGGMRRRVCIVRCMLANSEIILMDEPFKGLDDYTKSSCIEYIKANIRKRCIIIVTHNKLDVAMLNGVEIDL